MKIVFIGLIILVLVVAGVAIGTEASLNQNMGVKQITNEGSTTPLPLVNGVYRLDDLNVTTITISFNGSDFAINSVSNVHYGTIYANYTPGYHVVGNKIDFMIIAFQSYVFTLTFILHYTSIGWFGITSTHSQIYRINIIGV